MWCRIIHVFPSRAWAILQRDFRISSLPGAIRGSDISACIKHIDCPCIAQGIPLRLGLDLQSPCAVLWRLSLLWLVSFASLKLVGLFSWETFVKAVAEVVVAIEDRESPKCYGSSIAGRHGSQSS